MANSNDDSVGVGFIVKCILGLLLGIFILTMTMPLYSVYSAKMAGEAALARANQEKQIIISHAQAEKDAATLTADAIRTVGEAAQKYPEYREQEYIKAFSLAMENGRIDQIVYVATEAGIPILESSRLNHAR